MSSKILIIGPCENKKNIADTGGIIILFENLLSWLRDNNKSFKVIDTNKGNFKNNITAFLNILFKLFKGIPSHESISFHGTANDFLYLAPILILLCKINKKKVTLRKFAGNFDYIYNNSSCLKKRIYRYSLYNSNALFFETKHLVKFGLNFNKNCFWLPNTRKKISNNFRIQNKIFSKRFVFMSHISKTKGVLNLLEAFSYIENDYTLDFYGVIKDIQENQLNTSNVHYISALSKDLVIETLLKYDILILPSYRDEEGYPGIIIEALSLGIPIISTKIGGIQEMYTDGVEGYLVEPQNIEQLIESILKFNHSNYHRMSKKALERFNDFDSDIVYKEIENKMF